MLSDQVEDVALIGRVAAGDAEAFADSSASPWADLPVCAPHDRSPSIAEDVTQDVFLAVMSDATLRCRARRASVAAWLCGLPGTTFAGAPSATAGSSRCTTVVRMRALSESWPSKRTRSETSTRAESIQACATTVSSLPVRYREAVVVCDLEEMSYRDAAAALGCAVGTVRSRLHRGRALLAVKLALARGSRAERAGQCSRESDGSFNELQSDSPAAESNTAEREEPRMKCHSLRDAIVELARGEHAGPGTLAAIESHLEHCAACAPGARAAVEPGPAR